MVSFTWHNVSFPCMSAEWTTLQDPVWKKNLKKKECKLGIYRHKAPACWGGWHRAASTSSSKTCLCSWKSTSWNGRPTCRHKFLVHCKSFIGDTLGNFCSLLYILYNPDFSSIGFLCTCTALYNYNNCDNIISLIMYCVEYHIQPCCKAVTI